MNSTKIISELLSIEVFAEELKLKAVRLRSKLESVHSPASPKRGKKLLSDDLVANILANRRKAIIRKQIKSNTQ